MKTLIRVAILALCLCPVVATQAAPARYDPGPQTQALLLDEAQTVYLGNLARRQNGVPPLAANLQLTYAARWFSWDSVENRPAGFCGHLDTQGHWPDYRARSWGYAGTAGAENAFCGYVTPEDAIAGWLNSSGHRANLLDPNAREIGLGYYRRSDGRGYVTQDFGHDPVYAPLIINDEAINTTAPGVRLYLYQRETGSGGFAAPGPATEMMLANDRCFQGASWQPYAAEPAWALAPGEGWRTVYARTRDVFGRTATVSDTIYLGASAPAAGLGDGMLHSSQPRITLYGLNGGPRPLVQFSLGWLADDTFSTFGGLWGNGERVNDGQAWGGTAFHMWPGAGESSAWVWTTEFIKDQPLAAYVRLKVSDNSSGQEVARVAVTGGATLSLKGTDFRAAGVYQEFPIAFTFPGSETFLTLQFWGSGPADVYVDAATFFTAPRPVSPTMAWDVPGGNYRGQGVWLRYTDGGSSFSAYEDANLAPGALAVSPAALTALAGRNSAPLLRRLDWQRGCQNFSLQLSSSAAWLQGQVLSDAVEVTIDPRGLGVGTYNATLTITPVAAPAMPAVSVPVRLSVVEQLRTLGLPSVRR